MYIEDIVDYMNEHLKELKGKNIVIWGASEYAVRLFQYSDIINYDIQSIVDNCKAGQSFFGKQVLLPNAVDWKKVDAVVLASFYRRSEIIDELLEKYKYTGIIMSLDREGENKPFYQHILKSDMLPKAEDSLLLQRNTIFKNKHKGERVFILACGPSINLMDLSKLENEYTIAFNNFYLHKDIRRINPKYYVTAEWEKEYDENIIQAWAHAVYEKIPETTMFVSINDKKTVEKAQGLNCAQLFYYQLALIDDFQNFYEDIDFTQKILAPHSTIILCMQIALYMGFKEIYLLGTEHDFLQTGKYEHFYKHGEELDKREEENPDGTLDYPFREAVRAFAGLWEQYKTLKLISERQNTKIYNATIGGILDIFERINYNSLF